MGFYKRGINGGARGWYWWHTGSKIIPSLWEDLELIHTRIVNLKIDSKNSEDIKKLHELIAKGFWLGANLMITKKGNAQYMIMMMAVWYNLHCLSAPILSFAVPQIDCQAISTPWQLFTNMDFFLSLHGQKPD
jgi:hypothetical protein